MWQFIKNRVMNWMKELFWSIIHSLPPVDSRGSYCNSFVYEKEIRQFFKIKQMKESISNWEIIIIMIVRKKRRARVIMITQIKFRTTTTTMTTLKTMTMMTTNLEPWVASVCDVLSSSSFFHDKWQSKSGPIQGGTERDVENISKFTHPNYIHPGLTIQSRYAARRAA